MSTGYKALLVTEVVATLLALVAVVAVVALVAFPEVFPVPPNEVGNGNELSIINPMEFDGVPAIYILPLI